MAVHSLWTAPYSLRLTRFAVTVADVLSAPSTAPPFTFTDVLSVNLQKRSALLAFLKTVHSVSNRVNLFKIKKARQ